MYRRRSIFDSFTLSPLPYPVLLIIAVALILLGISSYINYVSIVESAGQRLNKNWILFSTPVLLIFLVRCLSSWDSADRFCASPPWDKRRRSHHLPSEWSSPWRCGCLHCVAPHSCAVPI
ncbi:hypothetical protein KPL70_023033 [Citrus sinensis]|nr:hypothetical protein KPL70_023033 [Citrus sinensis]